jgi:ubiquinone/menaquinone biosynthesis C-methylase UbiE
MKVIEKDKLQKTGRDRFLSDYHYALYEYYRSAKIIKELDNEKVAYKNAKILDDGCGSGGITVSLGEECKIAVGIDIAPKFKNTATKLTKELKIKNAFFLQSDGCALPFEKDTFDLIISHSVIEHTFEPLKYLKEAFRVLKELICQNLLSQFHFSFYCRDSCSIAFICGFRKNIQDFFETV